MTTAQRLERLESDMFFVREALGSIVREMKRGIHEFDYYDRIRIIEADVNELYVGDEVLLDELGAGVHQGELVGVGNGKPVQTEDQAARPAPPSATNNN